MKKRMKIEFLKLWRKIIVRVQPCKVGRIKIGTFSLFVLLTFKEDHVSAVRNEEGVIIEEGRPLEAVD